MTRWDVVEPYVLDVKLKAPRHFAVADSRRRGAAGGAVAGTVRGHAHERRPHNHAAEAEHHV